MEHRCLFRALPWVLCFWLFPGLMEVLPQPASVKSHWVGSGLQFCLSSGAGRAGSRGQGWPGRGVCLADSLPRSV